MIDSAVGAFKQMGTSLRVHVVGALIPGLILIVELWLLTRDPEAIAKQGVLRAAAATVEGVHAAAVIVAALVVGVAAAWLGYMARWIVWTATQEGPLQAWIRGGLPRVSEKDLEKHFGDDCFKRVLAAHPALADALPKPDDRLTFTYCKLFLRTHAPALAIDDRENEINALLALVAPLALAPVVAHELEAGPSLLTLGCVGSIVAVLVKVRLLREGERRDALRNLAFHEWFSTSSPGGRGHS